MAALAGLPQVEAVRFERGDDSFTVRYRGEPLPLRRVAAAVRTAVVGKPLRRLLDRLRRMVVSQRLTRHTAAAANADADVAPQPTRR